MANIRDAMDDLAEDIAEDIADFIEDTGESPSCSRSIERNQSWVGENPHRRSHSSPHRRFRLGQRPFFLRRSDERS